MGKIIKTTEEIFNNIKTSEELGFTTPEKPVKPETPQMGSGFGGGWGLSDLVQQKKEETPVTSETTPSQSVKSEVPKVEISAPKLEDIKLQESNLDTMAKKYHELENQINTYYEQYSKIKSQIDRLGAEINATPPEHQNNLINQYNSLAEQGNALLNKVNPVTKQYETLHEQLNNEIMNYSKNVADYNKWIESNIKRPEAETLKYIEESAIKDDWDAFRLGAANLTHRSKQFFNSALPNLIFHTITPEEAAVYKQHGITDSQIAKMNEVNAKKRDAYKDRYQKAEENYQKWLQDHPELIPRPEWEGGVIENVQKNPKLLLDPGYWGYVAAESAAFTIGIMGATLAGTVATGIPLVGMATGLAVAYPSQAQDLYEELVQSGASEEDAAKLSVPIGAVIAAVEVMGDLPLLASVSSPFKKILGRNISKEVGKRVGQSVAAKGIKTFLTIEGAENLEEIVQGAIQDATVRTVDENRSILANIPETTLRTFIATAPFALLGVAGEVSGVDISRRTQEKIVERNFKIAKEEIAKPETKTEIKPEVKPETPEVKPEIKPEPQKVEPKFPEVKIPKTRKEFETQIDAVIERELPKYKIDPKKPEINIPEIREKILPKVAKDIESYAQEKLKTAAKKPDMKVPDIAKEVMARIEATVEKELEKMPELKVEPKKPEPVKPKKETKPVAEPWQLTRSEFGNVSSKLYNALGNDEFIKHPFHRYSEDVPHEWFQINVKSGELITSVDEMYYRAIRRALSENKPVPQEALADYYKIENKLKKVEPKKPEVKVPEKEEVKPAKEYWQMTRKEISKLGIQKGEEQYQKQLEDWNNLSDAEKMKQVSLKPTEGWIVSSTENDYLQYHKTQVAQALKEGKPVPDEVLKEYPELKETPKTKPKFPDVKVKLEEQAEHEYGKGFDKLTKAQQRKVIEQAKAVIPDKKGEYIDTIGRPEKGLTMKYNPTDQWDRKVLGTAYNLGAITDAHILIEGKRAVPKIIEEMEKKIKQGLVRDYKKANVSHEDAVKAADDYIEGMKKKVGGETSFTRKELDEAYPKPNEIHEKPAQIQGHYIIEDNGVKATSFSDGDKQVLIDTDRLSLIKKFIPDYVLHLTGEKDDFRKPIVIKSKGETVGLVMPINDESKFDIHDLEYTPEEVNKPEIKEEKPKEEKPKKKPEPVKETPVKKKVETPAPTQLPEIPPLTKKEREMLEKSVEEDIGDGEVVVHLEPSTITEKTQQMMRDKGYLEEDQIVLTEKGKKVADAIKKRVAAEQAGIPLDMREKPRILTDYQLSKNTPGGNGFLTGQVDGKDFYSNSHFLLKGKPQGKAKINEKAKPDFEQVAAIQKNQHGIIPTYKKIEPVLYTNPHDDIVNNPLIWFDNYTAISAEYYDYIMKKFPDAEFRGTFHPEEPLRIYSKDEFVGMLMPIRVEELPANMAKDVKKAPEDIKKDVERAKELIQKIFSHQVESKEDVHEYKEWLVKQANKIMEYLNYEERKHLYVINSEVNVRKMLGEKEKNEKERIALIVEQIRENAVNMSQDEFTEAFNKEMQGLKETNRYIYEHVWEQITEGIKRETDKNPGNIYKHITEEETAFYERPDERQETLDFLARTQGIKLEKEPATPKRINKTQIMTWAENAFNIPIKGKATFRWKTAAGKYYTKQQIVRMEKWGELAVATHEIAHSLDYRTFRKKLGKRWRTPDKIIQKEMADLDYKQGPGGRRTHEGFAEYMRYRLTTSKAAELAPNFHKYFNEEVLPQFPDLMKKLDQFKEMLDTWNKQGAENRIIQHIDWKGEHSQIKGIMPKLKKALEWLNVNWNDEFYYPQKLTKEIEKTLGKDLRPTKNPAKMMQYSKSASGAIARTFVMQKAIDEHGNPIGPGLIDILKPITKKDMRAFISYAVSKRAINLAKRGIESGFDLEDALYIIDKYRNRGWDDTVNEVTNWSNHVLDWLVRAGAFDKATTKLFRALNPVYLPFKRAFLDEMAVYKGTGGYVDTSKGIKAIKGSGRPIINPLEAMVTQMRELINKAQKVRIAKTLIDISEKEGMGGFITRVPAPIKPTTFPTWQIKDYIERIKAQERAEVREEEALKRGEEIPEEEEEGWISTKSLSSEQYDELLTVFTEDWQYMGKDNIVSIWRDGERVFYEIHPDLYEALKGVDPLKLSSLGKVFNFFARMTRLGATGLKVAFGLARNPFRDAFSYAVFSKRNNTTVFDPIKGYYKDLTCKPGDLTWRFKALGGGISGQIGFDRASVQNTYDEMLDVRLGKMGKVLHIIKHPINTLTELLSITEMGPRSAELEAAYKKYTSREWLEKHPDWTEEDAYIQAHLDAKDVTVDFTKSGRLAKKINQYAAFFNVSIRGPEKLYRAFRERPIQTLVKGTVWLTLLAVGNWYKNKDKDWYKNLPPAYKYNNLWFEVGDNVYRLPIPFELGIVFMSAPQAFLDMYQGKDDKALKGLGELAQSQIPDPTPSAIKTALEVARNKNWLGVPIESEGMQYLYPTERKRDYTSKLAVSLSKGANEIGIKLSPIQIDYLIDGYSGGFLKQFRLTGDQLADYPVIGDLVLRDPNYPKRQLNEFFSEYELLGSKKSSDIATREEIRKYNRIKSFYSYYRAMQDRIKRAKEHKNDKLLKTYYKQLTERLERYGYK